MTHAELVARAARWLRNTAKCGVVLTECQGDGFEIPDAIGWRCGYSILLECKASRADFFADLRDKQRHLHWRLGSLRYYMTERGLLKRGELPGDWGLLEVHGNIVRQVRRATQNVEGRLEICHHEQGLLLCALRKIQLAERSNDSRTLSLPSQLTSCLG